MYGKLKTRKIGNQVNQAYIAHNQVNPNKSIQEAAKELNLLQANKLSLLMQVHKEIQEEKE